ncbi:uncharacterized protein [Asterias amurensis]|uniref:uncharacterized protein n=1 Tax=Asterias amurensis TaxID=7602 RepID=UPI003AB30858
MSEFCVKEFNSSRLDNRHDKLIKEDSLETDAMPLNESIPKSQEMCRQVQPLSDQTNQPDQENDTSSENNLCDEIKKMQITSHCADADDTQKKFPTLAQSKGQSYESVTPDLLQHEIRRGEHRGHDVGGADCVRANAGETNRFSYQSEMEAKAQAIPFDDDETQTATPQESLPSTTPKATNATSRTPQQDKVPVTPTPIQESASEPLLKPIAQKPPEEDDEHYDVLLLYSEHDQSEADQFIDIAKKANWKVATPDDFRPSQTKFKSFEDVYNNSSYTVLLLTTNFLADFWCEHQYQAALIQSIENPSKKATVIPIICQYRDLKLPMELSVFTSAKLKNPNIEKILKRCIKVEKRRHREKEAGLTPTDAAPNYMHAAPNYMHPKDESMDAIYHRMRPELQPGTSAAQIMTTQCFSELCVRLDAPDALENDWRRLATNVGFSSNSGLNQEKSPTAKILECFFQKEIAGQRSKDKIRKRLRQVLNEIHRPDAAELL